MLLKWIGCVADKVDRFFTLCVNRWKLAQLARVGQHVTAGHGFRLYNPACIELGDGIKMADQVTLRALTEYPWTNPPQPFSPRLLIEDGVFINNGCQISCSQSVHIGKDVMLAERCYVADHNHGFADPDRSIQSQPLTVGACSIGEGSWLGNNVCVSGSIRIGKHCVVGANSVVTKDLPDYSVAVGAPARVIQTLTSHP